MITAVDWLIDQLIPKDQHEGIMDIIQEAKEMEKAQIMKTAIKCHFEGVRQSAKTSEEYIIYAEQYYNETFSK
jgi:hypothetical protein